MILEQKKEDGGLRHYLNFDLFVQHIKKKTGWTIEHIIERNDIFVDDNRIAL